jgi:hypothetical protein
MTGAAAAIGMCPALYAARVRKSPHPAAKVAGLSAKKITLPVHPGASRKIRPPALYHEGALRAQSRRSRRTTTRKDSLRVLRARGEATFVVSEERSRFASVVLHDRVGGHVREAWTVSVGLKLLIDAERRSSRRARQDRRALLTAITVVVSALIALMKDQVDVLTRRCHSLALRARRIASRTGDMTSLRLRAGEALSLEA